MRRSRARALRSPRGDDGEGGIMALITLLRRWNARRTRRAALVLTALGTFGASLFLGDTMITPAIRVLSAVESLKPVEPSLEDPPWPLGTSGCASAPPASRRRRRRVLRPAARPHGDHGLSHRGAGRMGRARTGGRGPHSRQFDFHHAAEASRRVLVPQCTSPMPRW
ncbi:KUP/HAK/KT family potassium transporter [Streptomyces sp. HD]|uniref:KUP/HAK/KT family potassium transporter n=1 Tax=Streptomyces sp. HD TaxID=3020892 RepID=UPI00232D872C|nr:KUP/HAK/KT family potassium transporter [Streptomyces sp. HD]MDC0769036.1 KUP/HAK/KT family potassium transporter [Streptomyces sp. HD]